MDNNYIEQIKAIFKATGWTQQQLAQQLGVTHAALSRWLHGHASPQPRRLRAIASLYKEQVGFKPFSVSQRKDLDAHAQRYRIRQKVRRKTVRGLTSFASLEVKSGCNRGTVYLFIGGSSQVSTSSSTCVHPISRSNSTEKKSIKML